VRLVDATKVTFRENVPKAASHEPEASLAPGAMFAPAASPIQGQEAWASS
jgi:hypothetical protein